MNDQLRSYIGELTSGQLSRIILKVTSLSPEELRDILQLAPGKEWNPR